MVVNMLESQLIQYFSSVSFVNVLHFYPRRAQLVTDLAKSHVMTIREYIDILLSHNTYNKWLSIVLLKCRGMFLSSNEWYNMLL